MSAGAAAEWLEADGLGGFACGVARGPRTRRYHALLVTATTPPTGRLAMANGLDATVETPAGRFALAVQRYAPGVTGPQPSLEPLSFTTDPWPTWRFVLPGGGRLEQQLFVPRGRPAVVLSWRLEGAPGRLLVRPFFSGRDYHALHHANEAFRFEPERADAQLRWRFYAGVPDLAALTNGSYTHAPHWYLNFLYEEERERGLDHLEDLASPGDLAFDLGAAEALLVLGAGPPRPLDRTWDPADVAATVAGLRAQEAGRRARFRSRLERAADAYIVRRGRGATLVAGYPWFTDWGRDTFIAMRGLCLATGRRADARDILLEWSQSVSQGMLPNRFPDRGQEPEFNSVDAALWFVVAVHDSLAAAGLQGVRGAREEGLLQRACLAILEGYFAGTRHGIRADGDGLLACGEPGVQLTWMDARVEGEVVTPRTGKPVEVQALWINALQAAAGWEERWSGPLARARASFAERFWNEEAGALYDVVDVDHQPGRVDAAFRPNQILAVGGLPFAVLEGERARRVVRAVEQRLWTPLGLRSLAPEEEGYRARYTGGVRERDFAYHQGTVWPWLLGPFVEAWLRVHGSGAPARRHARARFVEPLLSHLDEAGLDHVSEIADAEPPHTPRGCPFQAWSLGELLRILRLLGAETH